MANQPGKDVLDGDDDLEEEFQDVGGNALEAPADKEDGDGPVGKQGAGDDEDIEVVLEAQTDAADAAAADADKDDVGADAEDAAADAGDDDALSAGGEDGDGAAADIDETDLDEEDRGYSIKMKKRILREKAVTRRAREEGQRALEAEREKILTKDRELLQVHLQLGKVVIANIETAIGQAKADLRAAKEVGDTDKEVEAQGKLAELSTQKSEAERKTREIEAAAVAFEEHVKQRPKPQQPAPEATPETTAWLTRNRWFDKPGFKAERLYVISLDKQLVAEGRFVVGTSAYFKELDRRIAKELPDLRKRVQQQARSPVANTRGSGAARAGAAPGGRSAPGRPTTAPANDRRVVLTKTDFENMRNFKLDPNNKEHQVQWAREKRALARSGAN
jgi:hypothetical protein